MDLDYFGSFLQVLIGLGIVANLWKIQRELGELTTTLSSLKDIVQDHEVRIRDMEKNNADKKV
tara:strand:+ start:192 stop:380 length:189 start_codon:yes stop_codon:yes gene_type:complete